MEQNCEIMSILLTNAVYNFNSVLMSTEIISLYEIIYEPVIIDEMMQYADQLNQLAEGMYTVNKITGQVVLNRTFFDISIWQTTPAYQFRQNLKQFLKNDFKISLGIKDLSPKDFDLSDVTKYARADARKYADYYAEKFIELPLKRGESTHRLLQEQDKKPVVEFHNFVGAEGGGEVYDFWRDILSNIVYKKIKSGNVITDRLNDKMTRLMAEFIPFLKKYKLPALIKKKRFSKNFYITDVFEKNIDSLLPYLISLLTECATHPFIRCLQLWETFLHWYDVKNKKTKSKKLIIPL